LELFRVTAQHCTKIGACQPNRVARVCPATIPSPRAPKSGAERSFEAHITESPKRTACRRAEIRRHNLPNCPGGGPSPKRPRSIVIDFPNRIHVVHEEGLEPPHLAVPEPKSGASANSATRASGPSLAPAARIRHRPHAHRLGKQADRPANGFSRRSCASGTAVARDRRQRRPPSTARHRGRARPASTSSPKYGPAPVARVCATGASQCLWGGEAWGVRTGRLENYTRRSVVYFGTEASVVELTSWAFSRLRISSARFCSSELST
jgi:hypothetical protein